MGGFQQINEDFFKKAWKLLNFFLSLQRQNESSGYPVNIYLMPRGASLDRHYSILIVTSGWLLFFIPFFEEPVE